MKQKNIRFKVTTDNSDVAIIDIFDCRIRTKNMLSFDKGLNASHIRLGESLSKYGYISADKRRLKRLIEGSFFGVFNAQANATELARVNTVEDLVTLIFYTFIPSRHRV